MTCNEILTHSGNISHEQAIDKAKVEYKKFKAKNDLFAVERDFLQQIEATGKKIKKEVVLKNLFNKKILSASNTPAKA